MHRTIDRFASEKSATDVPTYLDLPNDMAEAYMDAAFQHGPHSDEARAVYERFNVDPEWGGLFQEFAQAVDELKSAVSSGAAQEAEHLTASATAQ